MGVFILYYIIFHGNISFINNNSTVLSEKESEAGECFIEWNWSHLALSENVFKGSYTQYICCSVILKQNIGSHSNSTISLYLELRERGDNGPDQVTLLPRSHSSRHFRQILCELRHRKGEGWKFEIIRKNF